MAAGDPWSWFAARRPRRLLEHWDTPLAPSFVATRGVALALSVLVHGSVVAVAFEEARGASPAVAARAAERLVEVNADDLALEPPASEPSPLAAAPRAVTVTPVHHAVVVPPAALAPPEEPTAGSAAPLVAAPEPAAPRFVMTAPALAAPGSRAPTLVGRSGSPAPLRAAPLDERAVDVPAKLIAGTPPAYPPSAEAAGIEANVPVELVVGADGSVENEVALAHVGYGLDEAALQAVRNYRFAPARRAGSAVAVRMRWVVRFELR